MADGVCGLGSQHRVALQALVQVAGVHPARVLVGDLLDELERHPPALKGVGIQQRLGIAALRNGSKRGSQGMRVVDAAVHSHPAGRIVDVGGVAGQDHPPAPERVGHAPVHGVG